jgi:hypothetical protein
VRGAGAVPHTTAQLRTRAGAFSAGFPRVRPGELLAPRRGVIWFFEKDTHLLVCEIRRAADDETRYEFEIATAEGPKTQRFDSPAELIANYLSEQARLMKEGWRPRADLQVVD